MDKQKTQNIQHAIEREKQNWKSYTNQELVVPGKE